jgi:hypothetical protein
MTQPDQDALLIKIKVAVKAVNEAEKNVTTAQAEMTSRGEALGLLLLEAKKEHPKVKDFDAYLSRVNGLGLSRAYDFMRLAGGRTTDAELKDDARERKRKSRAKTKTLPKPKTPPPPAPEPKRTEPEVSVTVTESPATGDDLRAMTAAMREPRPASSAALKEFENACQRYLPQLNADDMKKARDYFIMDDWKKQKEVA